VHRQKSGSFGFAFVSALCGWDKAKSAICAWAYFLLFCRLLSGQIRLPTKAVYENIQQNNTIKLFLMFNNV
jgi:hypothetical protein